MADEPESIARPYPDGELVHVTIEGRKAFVIRPTKTLDSQRRWVWVTPAYLALPDARGVVEHRMYVDRFLGAGLHVAGIDVGATCGSPRGAEVYQKFYEHVTTTEKLNRKARMLGQSNGGLISLRVGVSSSGPCRTHRRHLPSDRFPQLAGARQGDQPIPNLASATVCR